MSILHQSMQSDPKPLSMASVEIMSDQHSAEFVVEHLGDAQGAGNGQGDLLPEPCQSRSNLYLFVGLAAIFVAAIVAPAEPTLGMGLLLGIFGTIGIGALCKSAAEWETAEADWDAAWDTDPE